MPAFFEGTRPGRVVKIGAEDLELPVLYFRDHAFGALFSADLAKLRSAMPSDRLHPVPHLRPGRGLLFIAAYDYLDSSAGAYGEAVIVVPAVYGRRPPPVLPTLLEASWPGFGGVVLHMPVTRRKARDSGRRHWGYAKFLAGMQFQNTPELQECRLDDGGEHILTLHVVKRGIVLPDRRPSVTYSVLDRALLRTTVPQSALVRTALGSGGSALVLGDRHPVARALRDLDVDPRPLMTRQFIDRTAILPEGQIVERNVRPLDGYFGSDREAGELRAVDRPRTLH